MLLLMLLGELPEVDPEIGVVFDQMVDDIVELVVDIQRLPRVWVGLVSVSEAMAYQDGHPILARGFRW